MGIDPKKLSKQHPARQQHPDLFKSESKKPASRRVKSKRDRELAVIENAFYQELMISGIPRPETEYQFHGVRRWRFDFAWPQFMVALEMEGGIFGNGKKCPKCKRPPPMGHTSVTGIKRDIEKYNMATTMGWVILRITPDQLCSRVNINNITHTIKNHGKK